MVEKIDTSEAAIRNWDAIAAMFGVVPRTMQARRKELQDLGVIFYRRVPIVTRNGKTMHQKCVFAFPSMLRLWAAKKSIDGKKF